jgi:hypothetical protein
VNRALLIASQTAGLRGCRADIALMAEVLGEWGFECTVRTDGTATRAGILEAYRGLIDGTAAGDAVVVYYSGHGGRIRNLVPIDETGPRPATNAFWQFIVPTDFEESTPDRFRGILAEELRVLQLELSTKTDNVTTILDCCHAALMSRDPALVARFLQRPFAELRPGAIARWEQADDTIQRALHAAGTEHGDAESNQRAVRVVACLPSESAFEASAVAVAVVPGVESDAVHGLLTAAFAGILREARATGGADDVTWDDVAAPLRSRVLSRAGQQHVLVEGPSRRRLFSSKQVDGARGWPVELADGEIRLPGAVFAGIGPGDTVSLVSGGRRHDAARRVDATVRRIEAGRAVLELLDRESTELLGPGTVAYPVSLSSPRRTVVVEAAGGPARDEVRAAIERSPRLEPAERAAAPLARVVVDDTGLTLVDQDGMAVYADPREATPAELDRLTDDLERLAKVAVLRELASGTGDEALDVPVALTVHATPDGPPLESGATLPLGSVFVRVHHLGQPDDPPLFVNVLDFGQVGDVTVLSADAAPTGIQLAPAETVQLYGDEGIWLSWPADGLPRDEPRSETFIAVFTDGEHDIRAVATSGIAPRDGSDLGGATSGSLQRMVDLATTGASRSIGERPTPRPAPLRYCVERFEFLLDPGFQIDESIDVTDRDRSRGAPVDVAVRLLDLVVRRNRAMFSTDVRLDAVFVTGAPIDDGRPFVARTWSFPRIADGHRLSADELALYVGPAQDFLEMAIWVSRANQENPNLAELIGAALQDPTLGSSAAGLFALGRLDPAGFAVKTGMSAVGSFLEAAGRVLRQAVNRSIGLYRTTLLVPEGLTTGRRPADGLREAQDMAFAYDVVVRSGS